MRTSILKCLIMLVQRSKLLRYKWEVYNYKKDVIYYTIVNHNFGCCNDNASFSRTQQSNSNSTLPLPWRLLSRVLSSFPNLIQRSEYADCICRDDQSGPRTRRREAHQRWPRPLTMYLPNRLDHFTHRRCACHAPEHRASHVIWILSWDEVKITQSRGPWLQIFEKLLDPAHESYSLVWLQREYTRRYSCFLIIRSTRRDRAWPFWSFKIIFFPFFRTALFVSWEKKKSSIQNILQPPQHSVFSLQLPSCVRLAAEVTGARVDRGERESDWLKFEQYERDGETDAAI